MPKEKTKIRVRIRKSRTGGPYSEVSYNAPHLMMASANQSSLFRKPAVRAGLFIAAAVVALIAAALMVMPIGSQKTEVTAASTSVDLPSTSSADTTGEASATPEELFPPSTAVFLYDDTEATAMDPAAQITSETGLGGSSAEQMVEQPTSNDETPSLEALEAEEARKALQQREAEGISAVREALNVAQGDEASAPGSLSLPVTPPNDVFAPEPSATPQPPPAPAAAPTAEETASDATVIAVPEVVESEDAEITDSAPTPEEPEVSSAAVARSQFAHDIVEREPVDAIDSVFYATGNDTDKIYYFTELVGLNGKTISHRWEYEGEVVATVAFDIGSDRWRVYSSKTLLPSMTGQWRVVVVDAEGNALQVGEFRYAPGDS